MTITRVLHQYRFGLFAAALFVLLLGSSFVIVGEDRQAVIMRLGQPDRVINRFRPGDGSGAGLAAKIPLFDQVTWLPRGLVTYSQADKRLRATDQQWLMIGSDVIYRIIDPVKLVSTLGDAGKIDAQFNSLLPALLDQELGQRSSGQIITPGAGGANAALRSALDNRMRQYGIQVIDVRIARVGLADNSLQSAYERMRERHEAALYDIQAKSAADAAAITATAEAEAAKRLQASAANDREFYSFFKAMRSYETLYGNPDRKNTTTIVLPPDSGYLRHFGGN
ncbi:MAG: hypothetical protein J0M19_00475 [Sphingomonadales bacterium]|nr:hypothetical protein [Sphingomonadales bacterium]